MSLENELVGPPWWFSGKTSACHYRNKGLTPGLRSSHKLWSNLGPVLQEAPGRGQEVPEGVRHGESGHVVHGLSLEEGLPAFH